MNNIRRPIFQISLLFSGIFFICMLEPAFAEDGAREWRPIYDFILRWINFGILVYFLVKVVGPILVNFLSSQQSEIRGKIERVLAEKDEILSKVQEAKDDLENSGPRLENIKSRIVDQGERRKKEIIKDANEHSKLMMKNARQRIDGQIVQARNKLLNELLDMAMEKVAARLPQEVSEEDNQRLIQRYLSAASAEQRR